MAVMSRIVGWLVLALLVIFIIFRPGLAADIFMALGGQLTEVVRSLSTMWSSVGA
jgi:hypothetical protein